MSSINSKPNETRSPKTTDPLEGFLLLDKPAGITSFGCVQRVKKILQANRVGHCGTLDPGATGLLILLINKATKAQNHFLSLEKEYSFRAQLGVETETGDLDGAVTRTESVGELSAQVVTTAMEKFTGEIDQLPPMYSALKFKGKPYYHYARKGVEIPRFPRAVKVHSFSLVSLDPPHWDARVVCSRGTYIRTLVEDVSKSLGTCGAVVQLCRERIGPYRRVNAVRWDQVDHLEFLRDHVQTLSEQMVAHA